MRLHLDRRQVARRMLQTFGIAMNDGGSGGNGTFPPVFTERSMLQ